MQSVKEKEMFIPTLHIATHSFGWVKAGVLASASWCAGWFAGEVAAVAMQIPPEVVHTTWYQHPAVISAIVTASFLFGTKMIDVYRDWGKEKRESENEEDERSTTLTGKIQELTQQERKELLGGLNALHEREVEFWQNQLTLKNISEFESRARAHRFGNEVNRLHGHIYACHSIISKEATTPIPDFQLRYYDELMEGVTHETEAFKNSLAERHKTDMRSEEK